MKIVGAFLFTLIAALPSFSQQPSYNEKYRPAYHYTPLKNWINDPNGLVYYAGEYHMFYQYNPFGDVWGHMSWGHAVSPDLVHWKELPVAIPEEGDVMIFSGSAVIDINNTSGFATKKGEVPMVAIYTGHIEGKSQSQHLAYSLDKGRTWKKYAGNPVLDLGKKDFRDPKVFWYEPGKKWVMAVVLSIEKKAQLYSSSNLKEWTFMSSFGPAGDTSGIWECPDLFRVPIVDSPGKYKWVFMHSPAPYMQYFVGEFDGFRFINENPAGTIYRPDYGPDYYAAIVYNNLPPGQPPVSIGWINNWKYAKLIPVSPWRGAMSLPRQIGVKKFGNEWILIQKPIEALNELGQGYRAWLNLDTKKPWGLAGARPSAPFVAELEITRGEKNTITIDIAGGALSIIYDDRSSSITIDRSRNNDFQNPDFQQLTRYTAPLSKTGDQLSLSIYFDRSIAEVFVNEGEAVLTAQIFPLEDGGSLTISSSNGTSIPSFSIEWMKSIWVDIKDPAK